MAPVHLESPVPASQGFTLLEVLIAVVILSIGLLGLAALQAIALRNNAQSYERSQATALAYEIADVMRANRVAAGNGAFLLDAGASAPAVASCENADATCTRSQMAAYTLGDWHRRLSTLLPDGTASIICAAAPCAAGGMQTVSVIWDEYRRGATSTACPPPQDFDETIHLACVQVSFIP